MGMATVWFVPCPTGISNSRPNPESLIKNVSATKVNPVLVKNDSFFITPFYPKLNNF